MGKGIYRVKLLEKINGKWCFIIKKPMFLLILDFIKELSIWKKLWFIFLFCCFVFFLGFTIYVGVNKSHSEYFGVVFTFGIITTLMSGLNVWLNFLFFKYLKNKKLKNSQNDAETKTSKYLFGSITILLLITEVLTIMFNFFYLYFKENGGETLIGGIIGGLLGLIGAIIAGGLTWLAFIKTAEQNEKNLKISEDSLKLAEQSLKQNELIAKRQLNMQAYFLFLEKWKKEYSELMDGISGYYEKNIRNFDTNKIIEINNEYNKNIFIDINKNDELKEKIIVTFYDAMELVHKYYDFLIEYYEKINFESDKLVCFNFCKKHFEKDVFLDITMNQILVRPALEKNNANIWNMVYYVFLDSLERIRAICQEIFNFSPSENYKIIQKSGLCKKCFLKTMVQLVINTFNTAEELKPFVFIGNIRLNLKKLKEQVGEKDWDWYLSYIKDEIYN